MSNEPNSPGSVNQASRAFPVQGAGLGLRRALMEPLAKWPETIPVDFMEVAPENWIPIGGRLRKQFSEFTERFPFVCHGLSLSLGGPEPLDMSLLQSIKEFLQEFGVRCYTEHLSYCSDHGHMYDLMPLPFTEEAVHHVAARIRQAQDFLQQRIGIEHVSYYASMDSAEGIAGQDMSEIQFINAVLDEADCGLLLDVNNIYVNSINHDYDPYDFLRSIPAERVMYMHVAGHYDEAEDLKVDTHGTEVIDPVWSLLDEAYSLYGDMPTLLERDFNFPPLAELFVEVEKVRSLQQQYQLRLDGQAGGRR